MEANLGIIEGFYGRVWSWQERSDMLDFMAANQFSSYWYAPKADECLRKHWQRNWSADTFEHLQRLSEKANAIGIQFGIGLSPLDLYGLWREGKGRDELSLRLDQIAELKPRGLALLFDDMQGNLPLLAETQAEIAHYVANHIQVDQLILCPSYYSFDPILEQLFGEMPEHYWRDLGRLLDSTIDLFWTGDKVISQEYSSQGLVSIGQLFQRKPVIWDNSIVNDGRKTSPFLTLRSMFESQLLQSTTKSIIVNPMNAPYLSQISLATLLLSGTNDERFKKALMQVAPDLYDRILECLPIINKGRDALTDNDIECIEISFRGLDSFVAKDIIHWLDGAFQFDPACLT